MILIAAAGTAGTSFALSGDARDPVRTADEVYSKGMTLETISKLSQGTPGQVAPPCPDEATVNQLKLKNLPIGPCDPFPEPGQPVLLPKEADTDPPSEDGPNAELCDNILAGDLSVTFPCGVGLRVLDSSFPTVKGEECIRVSWIPRRGAASIVDTLCPSSPKAASGAALSTTESNHLGEVGGVQR